MALLNTHQMKMEWIADTQTLRFTCPICQRCLESGPDGIRLMHRGDQSVRHSGGDFATESEVQQASGGGPVLH